MSASTLSSDIRLEDLLAGASEALALNTMSFLRPSNVRQHHHGHHNDRQEFGQSNLVSDNQGGHLSAQVQDNNLINPWGISFAPTGPFWIANNHTGTSTLYNVDPTTDTTTVNPLVVTIAPPPGQTGPASPTGTVFNNDPNPGFLVNGKPAAFIFSTEDGTISAWNGGTQTTLEVNYSGDPAHGDSTVPPAEGIGAVYKGLTIGTENGTTLLYAANFRHGTVDVFNDQWQQVMSLTDGNLPAGYAPFNAQVLDGHLFVTYAKQDEFKHDDVSGKGNGFVDEFDLNGNLIDRVASHGPLNSPWGLAIAPTDFGKYAGDLLVGNFGDGTISAFDLNHNDQNMGKLLGIDGKPITIDDLWALTPGNGTKAGSSGNIYFTAGGKAETQGLFGSLSPVADTNTFMITGVSPHSMTG
jgi:uncharacterized protein (TIGR03118 family)